MFIKNAAKSSVSPSVARLLPPVSHDTISQYLVDGFQWNLPQIIAWVWALLKRFSRSKVKVICIQICECCNGGGIHFDGVASCRTCNVDKVIRTQRDNITAIKPIEVTAWLLLVADMDVKKDEEAGRVQPTPLLCSTRLGLSIIGFFMFFHLYAQRVGMSVAIVSMVNQTAVSMMASGRYSSCLIIYWLSCVVSCNWNVWTSCSKSFFSDETVLIDFCCIHDF